VKTRYFIFISFKGTFYHGWQIQPGAVTIQQKLEEALSTVLQEPISATGAGRTDTGVHAKFFCAHFDSAKDDLIKTKNLITRLNMLLPKDISAKGLNKVSKDAHARFSAVSRTYKYFISNTLDPFNYEYSWFFPVKLDLPLMNEACRMMLMYSDFTSFSKLHSDVKTNYCRIFNAHWEYIDDNLMFTIKADRFLRNMVRAVVGTTVDVGRGRTSLKEFEEIILSKNRCKAGKSAPAKGLFLTDIEYPEGTFTNGPEE